MGADLPLMQRYEVGVYGFKILAEFLRTGTLNREETTRNFDVDTRRDSINTFIEAIVKNMQEKILFVTDSGHVGVTYQEDLSRRLRNGDLLAGLFGVNFPFVLRPLDASDSATTHRVINKARVAKHDWGHRFLGNVRQIGDISEDWEEYWQASPRKDGITANVPRPDRNYRTIAPGKTSRSSA